MIRAMVEAEAGEVAALIRAAFAAITVPLDPPPSALGETAASVSDQLRQGGGFVWDEGGVRGCVLWRVEGEGVYLARLSVAPGWQGRGIARALVAATLAQARQAGHARVHLGVRLSVAANRRLFAAMGFRELEVQTHPGQSEPTWVKAEYEL